METLSKIKPELKDLDFRKSFKACNQHYSDTFAIKNKRIYRTNGVFGVIQTLKSEDETSEDNQKRYFSERVEAFPESIEKAISKEALNTVILDKKRFTAFALVESARMVLTDKDGQKIGIKQDGNKAELSFNDKPAKFNLVMFLELAKFIGKQKTCKNVTIKRQNDSILLSCDDDKSTVAILMQSK